jgi:hypothetical protein
VKNPDPKWRDWFKYAITVLLTAIRFTNALTTSQKKQALLRLGRTVGWWSLCFNKPILKNRNALIHVQHHQVDDLYFAYSPYVSE